MKNKIAKASLLSVAIMTSTAALAEGTGTSPGNTDTDLSFSPFVEMVGGFYYNEHMWRGTAGREHQMKMTRAIFGSDFEKGNWKGRLEVVGLGDEVKHVDGDRAYEDIYRNIGTDLYYYGDNPVREAWVGQDVSWGYWKAGRMVNLLGEQVKSDRFSTYIEAPNAVFLGTGILNGFQIGWNVFDDVLALETAILWGRDRPCLGALCYLDGKLDPNEKGNNTPVIELKATLTPIEGLEAYGGYRENKLGSAVGSFNSGKHNDNRLMAGLNYNVIDGDSFKLTTSVEYNRFVVGLTEEGVQGEASPVEANDIVREGVYGIVDATLPQYGVTLRYTHEKMDRMDAAAWQDIAAFDRDHPVNDATESRNIITLIKDIGDDFSVKAYYRQDDVPYLTASQLELEDKFGLVFDYKTYF